MFKLFAGLLFAFPTTSASAQNFSLDELLGRWEFVAYAEVGSPDERTSVEVVYDFRPDGIVVAELTSGNREWRYRVEGETLYFISDKGEEDWFIQSFEPGTTMVLIDEPGAELGRKAKTLVFMERR